MKKRIIAILFTFCLLLQFVPVSASAIESSDPRHSVAVICEAFEVDAVVFPDYSDQEYTVEKAQSLINSYYIKDRLDIAFGTCFFVGKNNEDPKYAITNHHCVEDYLDFGSGQITPITIYDETNNINIELIGRSKTFIYFTETDFVEAYVSEYDDKNDVALLNIEKPTDKRAPLDLCLPTEDMVNKKCTAVGFPGISDNVYTHPNSVYSETDATVTSGVVGRLLTTTGKGTRTIQTDCQVNHGNSGGPLLNDEGAVIGINTSYHGEDSSTNYYAVSIEHAITLLKRNSVDYNLVTYPRTDTADSEEKTKTNDTKEISDNKGLDTKYIIIIAVAAVIVIALVIFLLTRKKGSNKAPVENAEVGGADMEFNNNPAVPVMAPQFTRNPYVRSLAEQHRSVKASLANGKINIGRSSDCAIVFSKETPGVSSKHCSVSFDFGANDFVLTDLNSTYGTYLSNGQKLNPGVAYHISAGERFYLGEKQNTLSVELE